MKNTLIAALSIFAVVVATLSPCSEISAQDAKNPKTISLSNLNWGKYRHRVMPSKPQDPLFFNYGVRVESTPSVRGIYPDVDVMDRMKIEGQRKVDQPTENDYFMKLTLGNLMIVGSQVIKTGNTDYPKYYVQLTYSFNARVSVSKDGEILSDIPIFSPDKRHNYDTETFDSYTAANKFWQNNSEIIRSELFQKVIDASIIVGNESVSTEYGFWITETSEEVKTLQTKKHSEYAPLYEKVESMKAKFKQLDGTTPMTETDFSDEITYFKGLLGRYPSTDPKNKVDSKMRYVAYYNLCVIYLVLDQPLETIAWADKLIANDQFPKQGEKFKKDAEKLISIFADSFFKVRQFDTAPYLEQLQ